MLLAIVALGALTQSATAQVYLGAGYAETIIGDNFYIVNGVAISLQREVSLGEGRWRAIPTLHTALLFNDFTYNNVRGHATTVSLSPLVSYNLIQSGRFALAPYAGPFVSWLFSYREEPVFLLKPRAVNRWLVGGEVGLSVRYHLTDQLSAKLVPISVQFGNDFYQQAIITLSFKL